MLRKGDSELQLLAFLFLLSTIAQWGFMFGAPAEYKAMVEHQIRDGEPVIKTGIIRANLEDTYIPQAVIDAAYQGMYEKGQDGFGPWNSGDVPVWSEVKAEFDTSVNNVMDNSYAGVLRSGAGCTLNGNEDITIENTGETVRSNDDAEMTFSATNDGPLHAECRALSFTGTFTSLVAKEVIPIPENYITPRMRYQQMHGVAETIATDAAFSSLLNTAEKSVKVASKTGCAQSDPSQCGWSPPSLSFSNDDDIENAQEEQVADRLLDELHNQYQTAFADQGFEVTFEVRELEYTPYNIQQIQNVEWRVQCLESASDTYVTYTSICGGSCDPDGSCDLSNPGARCSSFCGEASSAPGSDPGPESDSGTGYWTDNPWSGGCGFSHSDPFTYSGTSNVAFRSSELLPMNEYTGGAPAPDPGGETCEPSCSSSRHTCREYLGSESNTRASWRFDLESYTVVEVTITDTSNEIPTSDGFVNPVYRFTYEQRDTAAAGTAPST